MAEQDRQKLLQVLEWINGKDNGVQMYHSGPQPGTKWYIVSTKWLNKWKQLNKLTDEVADDQMQEDLGRVNSEDIIYTKPNNFTGEKFLIKPDLRLGVDYEALPKRAWKFFKTIYGYEQKIIRKSIGISPDSTQIEVSLFKLRVVFVIDKTLNSPIIKTFHFSRSSSLNDVLRELNSHAQTLMKKCDYPSSKLWKLDLDEISGQINGLLSNEEKEKVAIEKLEELVEGHRVASILFPGVLIEKGNQQILNLELRDADLFVVETKGGYNYSDIFREKNKEMCEYCRKLVIGPRKCFCKKYFYCNDMCEEKDRNYHCCRKKVFTKTEFSRMGKVGLQNLGNTCYMNSGLQCLSNTKKLTNFILEDSYLNDINTENILGSKGELINEYAALIKEMWYGTSTYVSPWGVKKAFSDFAKQFMGYHQQDSQEMLGFLIDGIHEDLNRVKVKPYVEDPTFQGITEQEYANKFWENHLKRNNSVIVDLMHGQYRSEVECPDCFKVSLTFDPFLMVTLPIPERELKNYEFIYIDLSESIKGKVNMLKGSSAGQVRARACELLSLPTDNIVMAEVSMNTLKSILTPESKAKKRSTLILYKVLNQNLDNDEYYTIFLDFRKKAYGYNGAVIGNPFLFTVKKDVTMEGLHKEVFRFVLKLKKMEIDDIDEEFKKSFPSFFTRSYSENNYFSLKVHNPHQFPCAICDRVSCPGCNLQYESKNFSYYMGRCKESHIRISVNLTDTAYDYSFLSNVTNHESYFQNFGASKQVEKVHLNECFKIFSKKEQLDENNTIYCSNCKGHKRGLKKMEIFRLPEILIIHLKRFKQKGQYSSKNNKIVEFPIEGLDMSQFSIGQEGVYDLYAVSNHYGSLEGGHYTAYAKCFDGQWRDFDDNSVSLVNNVEETIIGASAYVLFYEKRKVPI